MPVTLKPPIGVPTQSTAGEERAWAALVDQQLDNARKSAENWRNGLAAFLGGITGFSLIKGHESISGLVDRAAIVVGVALLLAIIAAAWGAWLALEAAYGAPTVLTREDVRRVGGATGLKFELAERSAWKIAGARRMAIATLAFLVVAVGVTWYGPRLVSVDLDVESRGLAEVCGALVASGNGALDIKPFGSPVVHVELPGVVRLRLVEKCQ